MKTGLGKYFSGQYANHAAIGNNYLLWVMYRVANPFAVILYKIGISPNSITSISTLLAILSAAALVMDNGWVWFTVFWSLSVLLDFCDGTVARMSGKVRKCAFRYDHMSDLFKIFIVFMGAGIRYDDASVWVGVILAVFMFMYFTVLNHDYWAIKNNQTGDALKEGSIATGSGSVAESGINRCKTIYHRARAIVMVINGHTLLLFLLLPHGVTPALFLGIYIALVSLSHIKRLIKQLLAIPK